MCVCVCACVSLRLPVRVRVRVLVGTRTPLCVCVCVCVCLFVVRSDRTVARARGVGESVRSCPRAENGQGGEATRRQVVSAILSHSRTRNAALCPRSLTRPAFRGPHLRRDSHGGTGAAEFSRRRGRCQRAAPQDDVGQPARDGQRPRRGWATGSPGPGPGSGGQVRTWRDRHGPSRAGHGEAEARVGRPFSP
jgi:hypothetical protein